MSHFSWPIDGSIIGVYLVMTMTAGVMVRKFVGRVDHFLVAGREMNLYLGIASLAATEFGIVTCMYSAQCGYKQGFAGSMPGILQAIAMLVIGVTGFCVKPLRDSGVLTIPELFETRFGPFIRWLSGVVIVLGGLLNMGVFLRVGGDFLVLVTGMDPKYLVLIMSLLLLMVAVYTILGGMLSVLVTDFLQFVMMSIGLLGVTFLIIYKVGFDALFETVRERYGAGGFNPFYHPELGTESIIGYALVQTAATLTWQTTIARLLSAKDSWTGQKIYIYTSFFFVCGFLIPGVWGIAALHGLSPEQVAALGTDPEVVSMSAMPVYLGTIIPIGLMGFLVAAMLAAEMSTDSSYMITWAAVIYNDILGPFRRKGTSETMGLLMNRMIVAMIGLFLFFYGLFYKLEGGLWDYLTTTGTIYLSSMSVLLIACCYWPHANNWGAAAAIVVGAGFPIAYLVLEKTIQGGREVLMNQYYCTPDRAKIASFVLSAVAMIVFSLMKPHQTSAQPGTQGA